MEYLVTAPEILATTAADVGEIGSAITDANANAAGPTAGLVAAAKDEVSEAIAELFGGYGQQYQAVLTKAAAFHDDFARRWPPRETPTHKPRPAPRPYSRAGHPARSTRWARPR